MSSKMASFALKLHMNNLPASELLMMIFYKRTSLPFVERRHIHGADVPPLCVAASASCVSGTLASHIQFVFVYLYLYICTFVQHCLLQGSHIHGADVPRLQVSVAPLPPYRAGIRHKKVSGRHPNPLGSTPVVPRPRFMN